MRPMRERVLVLSVILSASIGAAQTPLGPAAESAVENGRQLTGLVPLTVDGKPVDKRFVIRTPTARWNGALVVGAHGGSGGNNSIAPAK